MLEKIKDGLVNKILAWHPDRLAKNAVDSGKIIHLLDKGELVDLKFATHWFLNTPQGILLLTISFGQSKFYSDSLAINTKRGLREKVRCGEKPGVAPRGYLNDKAEKNCS